MLKDTNNKKTTIINKISTVYLIAIGLFIIYKIYVSDFRTSGPLEYTDDQILKDMYLYLVLLSSYILIKLIDKLIQK